MSPRASAVLLLIAMFVPAERAGQAHPAPDRHASEHASGEHTSEHASGEHASGEHASEQVAIVHGNLGAASIEQIAASRILTPGTYAIRIDRRALAPRGSVSFHARPAVAFVWLMPRDPRDADPAVVDLVTGAATTHIPVVLNRRDDALNVRVSRPVVLYALFGGPGWRTDRGALSIARAGPRRARTPSVSAHSSVELVHNGSFETPSVSRGSANPMRAVPGWGLVYGPAIEVQRHLAGAPYAGEQFVELDSHASSAIRTHINTEPGAEYRLRFAFSPRPGTDAADNQIEVLWAGERVALVEASGLHIEQTSWTEHVYTRRATSGHTAIEFRHVGRSSSRGGYLDAVSVTRVGARAAAPAAVTPESVPSGDRQWLLPARVRVYVRGDAARRQPDIGFEPRDLPVSNRYAERDGCYVACYSRDAQVGVYPAGDGVYAAGLVRTRGRYVGHACHPTGFDHIEISRALAFHRLCAAALPACDEACWASRDTGRWLDNHWHVSD